MKEKLSFKTEATAKRLVDFLENEHKIKASIQKENEKFVVQYDIPRTESLGNDHLDNEDAKMDGKMRDMMFEFEERIMGRMRRIMDFMFEEINFLQNKLFDHLHSGHIPPIKGASKMKNALEVLGLGDDFEVVKPRITASIKNNKSIIEVDFLGQE